MNPYYTDYSEYLARLFPGVKVQKLSIDGGMTCPNRDGTLGTGGCIYCNNSSFSPQYTRECSSVSQQIERGRQFFARKYPQMQYLAYFQNYTNTYAPVDRLRRIYTEALSADGVVGIIIGTRPDCLPPDVTSLLAQLATEHTVMVELGIETSHDTTLEKINRHHTWSDSVEAVQRLKAAGVETGLHLIAGLPGEDREMILHTIDRVAKLAPASIKMHQMQVIEGTELAQMYREGKAPLLFADAEGYIDFCVQIIRRLPRSIAIERFVSQSPAQLLVAPRWGLKNYEFTHLLHKQLAAFEKF